MSMTNEELDKLAKEWHKKTYPSYIGYDKFVEELLDAYKAGYKAAISQNNDDPYGEYFEKDAGQKDD